MGDPIPALSSVDAAFFTKNPPGRQRFNISGTIVRDTDVINEYADSVSGFFKARRWGAEPSLSDERLTVMSTGPILLTSCFLPVEIETSRLFINQSYSNLAEWFGRAMRPKISGQHFSLRTSAVPITGRHVVMGGPIDGVWWHWVLNWAPRYLLLKQLRPDLFYDPEVRFIVDRRAGDQPYLGVLEALGLDLSRLTFVDPAVDDFLVEQPVLVSFLDQQLLFPALIDELADLLLKSIEIRISASHVKRRVYTSRQGFKRAKRRVQNFVEIQTILTTHNFEVVELGSWSLPNQVRLFSEAEIVVGVHGSDLTNLIFCDRGTKVYVFETSMNVTSGIADAIQALCEIRGLEYQVLQATEIIDADADYATFAEVHNRDVHADADGLRKALSDLGPCEFISVGAGERDYAGVDVERGLQLAFQPAVPFPVVVSARDLDGYRVGLPYDPNVWLVYHGRRHRISSPMAYDALFSDTSAILILPDLSSIPEGPEINDGSCLVSASKAGPAYFVTGQAPTQKYLVPSADIFSDFGFCLEKILAVPSIVAKAVPEGPELMSSKEREAQLSVQSLRSNGNEFVLTVKADSLETLGC
jgi:hypothetical protein